MPHEAKRQATHARTIFKQFAVWQFVIEINIHNPIDQYKGFYTLELALEQWSIPSEAGPTHAHVAL
jgi:hypothetical protein